jgi:hypothetical protein
VRDADQVDRVAQRLRAGEITAAAAVKLLIEDAVERQVGLAVGDREELAAALKRHLARRSATDPWLTARVRRLDRRS